MYEKLEKIAWFALPSLEPGDEVVLVVTEGDYLKQTVHGKVRHVDDRVLELYDGLSLPVSLVVDEYEHEEVLTFLREFNDPKYKKEPKTFTLNTLLVGWNSYKVSLKEED